MALINCSECNHEVSDKAEACPKCGAPIAGGIQIKTIQETSKKFKLQTLKSVSLIIIGIFWLMVVANKSPSNFIIPVLLIFIGVTWYMVNLFRIWWHHK